MNLPGRRKDHSDGSLLRKLDDFGIQLHMPSDDAGMTRPIGAPTSSLMMTGRWLAVWRPPRWSWWQVSMIARWLMMTMMLRGRGRRTVVRHFWNTAGLGTFHGAGTARVTWAGPLVLSSSGLLMSGRVLSIVGPVSSLTVRNPRPMAVRPVRAGPFHYRNHGLWFRGPRTRGFRLDSFGIRRPVAAGMLGGELKRIVRRRGFLWSRPRHHVRWLSSPPSPQRRPCVVSSERWSLLEQPMPQATNPCKRDRNCFGYKSVALHSSVIVGSEDGRRFSFGNANTRESWAEIQLKTTGHVIAPPFCPRRYAWQRRKQMASHATYLPKTSSWAQLTNFTESHNYLLSLCSINAWEGQWYSAWIGLTSVHEQGENRSERLADVVLCAGAAAHGQWRGLNFIVWNFAWHRLASRLYAATAATFFMKTVIHASFLAGKVLFQNQI